MGHPTANQERRKKPQPCLEEARTKSDAVEQEGRSMLGGCGCMDENGLRGTVTDAMCISWENLKKHCLGLGQKTTGKSFAGSCNKKKEARCYVAVPPLVGKAVPR